MPQICILDKCVRMKHFSISIVLLILGFELCCAQITQTYQEPLAQYNEGVNLYMQHQYGASYRQLSSYLESDNVENEETARFYLVADMFELRSNTTHDQLKDYLKDFPYTQYAAEIHYMQGVLMAEKGKYKQAIKEFEDAEVSQLSREHQSALLFYRGYAHLRQNEPQRASLYFDKLRRQNTIYTQQAQYYYAYCNYTIQNYGKALPAFLAIEQDDLYKNIVPYYIIQIYYAQQQYDEVFTRADYLLSHKIDNANNGELHRMVGEIYYQQGDYAKAISHLQEYAASEKEGLMRNDVYLLGMSYYQLKDYANAASYLSQVKQQNDSLSQNTCLHLANSYVQLGKTEQAKLAYRAATQMNFNDTIREEALYNYAITTYKASSALGESITAFNDFLSQYPNSKHCDDVYALLCDMFMSSKNYKAAYEALTAMNTTDAKMVETKEYLLYQMGTDDYVQNKTESAIDNFTQVINGTHLNETYLMESYFWRGEAYYKLRDYDKAYADLNAFLQNPRHAQSSNYEIANYSMGYCLFSQKKYSEAKTFFETYTKTADHSLTTYADALNRIGDCYFNARDFVKAENVYAKVIGLGAVGADYATFQRGYALGLLKRYGDKISTLEQLVKQYPKSDYADDALYEIARAELMRNNNSAAIEAYESLLAQYPNSTLARKATLEKAMIYYNDLRYDEAIASYKQVINNYTGSEEAYSALEGLESVYIETNRVNEYFAYVKTLGKSNMKINNKEDSLRYVAAERQYMLGNYKDAATGLQDYVNKYCAGGRYCTMAQYFLADSYYQLNKTNEALAVFTGIADAEGSPYREEACMRVAELSFDNQDFATALTYFKKMQTVASTSENTNIARLGVLRCSYFLNDNATTIQIADEILAEKSTAADVKQEAMYNRAKAYYQLKQYDLALADFQEISKDVRVENGAESKYHVAEIYLLLNELDKAEAEVMDFAGKNTSYQFWLAKSFIVLSDVYVARGETFQAQQYLLSLQANYKVQDEIQTTIVEKLQALEETQQEEETIDEDNEDE